MTGERDGDEPFGLLLRRLRERAGLTQEQLAERAGLSTNAVGALERGIRRRPYRSTVRMLAEALGLTVEERVALERCVAREAGGRRRAVADQWRAPVRGADGGSMLIGFPTPRQLPARTRDFVGRAADLAKLDALLPGAGAGTGRNEGDLPGSTAVISAIGGTAGVGKTALAVVWAHRVQGRFPDGQLYTDLRGYDSGPPADPGEVLDGFLRALSVAAGMIPAVVEQRAALFRSLVHDRRMLVVLDNASSAAQVRPLLPGSASCLTVVTSRVSLTGLAVSVGAVRITLDVLPLADAVALLRTIIGSRADAEPHSLATMAELCARLPLALRLAGHRAAGRPDIRIADLVTEMATEGRRLDLLSAEADERSAVRTVFSWSYRGLPVRHARMFRLLGLHSGPDISTGAAAALAGVPPTEVRELLDGLADAHLVRPVGTDRWRLHDLLRVYARERAETGCSAPSRAAAIGRLTGFYLHTAAVADHLLHPGRDRAVVDGALPPAHPARLADYDDALRWCEAERANAVAVTHAAARHGLDAAAWQLPTNLWSFFYIRRYWSDWTDMCGVGLRAARRSGQVVGQCRMLDSLASGYRHLHRFAEAIDHYRQALELRRQSGDRFGESVSLVNLSDAYLGLHQYEDALEHAHQSLILVRQFDDPYSEGIALGNYAEACVGLRRYDQALEAFGQVLELCRKINHRYGESLTLIHLGEAHAGVGNHDDAIDHLIRARDLCRELGNSHGEGIAWKTLGQVYLITGEPALARDCMESAEAVFATLGGPELDEIRRQLQTLNRMW